MKASLKTSRTARRLLPYLLILPGVALVLAILYPFFTGIWWSLTNYDLTLGLAPKFIGLTNYVRNFTGGGEGLHATLITVLYAAGAVIVQTILGFAVALMLMRDAAYTRVFRALIVLPLLMPPVIATIMWRVMMTPNGVLNYLLGLIGLPSLNWLGSTSLALPSVVLIDTWIYTPFAILILLAGIQSIPEELFEAARVDGARFRSQLTHIIIPLLRPFFIIVIVFRGIDSLKMFDIIYTATSGGPVNSTMSLHLQAYFDGIRHQEIGSAMSLLVILWIFCYGLSFVLLRRRREALV